MKRILIVASKYTRPPQKLLPSQWADKYRFLSPEASAEPGRWRTERTIYQKEIMDCAVVKSVKQIVIMSSSQIGKTELLLNILGFFLDYEPTPILALQPTLEMAEAFSKDRIAPMLRDSPCFRDKIKNPRSRDSGNTLLHKQFKGGGRLTLAGANSPASLASRPVRIVLCDECDRFPTSAGTEGDPINLALKRMTTFWNKLSILVSTPTIKDKSRIEKAFAQSDQRHYYVPCPHCGHRQVLRWENLHYEGKGTTDYKIDSLGYFCESCGALIPESNKPELLRRGKWVSHAVSKGIAGFHLNELYSPWKSWSDVALDYEAAREDPNQYKVWWNTSLGLPIEEDSRIRYEWENLLSRSEVSDYSMGQVPATAFVLTAGVDVQFDRLEAAIFGWGIEEEAFLVNYQVIEGSPLLTSTWTQLEDFLEIQYPHPLGAKIKVLKSMIDTGYATQEVYQEILKRRHWWAIKGKAGDRPLVSPPTLQEVNYQGKRLKTGIKLYTLGVDQAKKVLLNRCKIDLPGKYYLNLPQGLSKEWAEGFAGSEVLLKKHRQGQPYYVWEPVPGVANEPLDTAVYAYCAAILAGITRMNFEKIKQQLTVETHPTAKSTKKSPPKNNWTKSW